MIARRQPSAPTFAPARPDESHPVVFVHRPIPPGGSALVKTAPKSKRTRYKPPPLRKPKFLGNYANAFMPGKQPHPGVPFQKGNSGFRGSTSAGGVIAQCMNAWALKPLGWVKRVAKDPNAPLAYRIAAKRLVLAMSGDAVQSGDEFDRIMDRTVGRPTQNIISASVQFPVKSYGAGAGPEAVLGGLLQGQQEDGQEPHGGLIPDTTGN